MRWKISNYMPIILKMYWETFSNTSYMLKIVTDKNDAKIVIKVW